MLEFGTKIVRKFIRNIANIIYKSLLLEKSVCL